jgi:hypothetical protein
MRSSIIVTQFWIFFSKKKLATAQLSHKFKTRDQSYKIFWLLFMHLTKLASQSKMLKQAPKSFTRLTPYPVSGPKSFYDEPFTKTFEKKFI